MTQWTEHTRKADLFIQEINMRLNNRKKIYRCSILWQYCLNEKRIAKFFFLRESICIFIDDIRPVSKEPNADK